MNIIGRLTKDAEVRTLSGNRQVVNFSIATNESYRSKEGERVEQTTYFDCAYWISPKVKYIFLTTSHDGSGSITAAFTPIRIVCQNTLNASLRNMSNVVRIRHTSGAKQRLDDAHKVMGLANTLSIQLQDIFNHWAKVKVTDSEVKKLIQLALCPNRETLEMLKTGADDAVSAIFRNTVKNAFAYAMASDTQQMETAKGTLYGAYNAVTGYYQNVRTYKDDEAKLQSIMMGGTAQLKSQKAFELCTSFAVDGDKALMLN